MSGVLDLRGKSLPETVALLGKCCLLSEGRVGTSDTSHLFSDICPEYTGVVCIWLDDKMTLGWSLILWDGHIHVCNPGEDIHGFIRADGGIDWGVAWTMQLMR